jgi:hypothetical protein
VAEQSLSSYLDILRARDYPETLVDLVVPGVLEDFDLPDLAALAGPGRVTLVGPVTATGIALEPAEAAAAYGGHARVVSSPADVVADLVR